ncbi:hypothetical protein COCCU_12245 [Corynebacterium occultum]|uniref:Tubulin-like protein n=1 Tax=Corynebacterium occultum TaxID=2675219 RepID=A0A6B8VZC1_9CORY|nr:tubulin-like doman-containing protein [Corynebacterium occultum]QGU08349.1 hypothetical protein COCCU_12245 [Corynebacterium occultum]
MRKIFVVGCGGSGAKTLAYMMDQLKTTLAEKLPERYPSPKDVKLPRAWQFVSVDVPTSPESAGANLPNVSEAGGRYISCGSTERYYPVDTAVSNQLGSRRELGTIASWALPNPESETTVISAGAGQYRSIGRMLILSKLQEVQQELRKSWDVLFTGETDRELADLRNQLYNETSSGADSSQSQPLVFVVSSMAGGAGASMALDICRLLTGLEGIAVGNTSLFMVTPDIFSQLSPDAVAGANPNALAMFSELLAAQLGSATESDQRIFQALGVPVGGDSVPVGRIFPVGVRSGENGALLGDGQADTVYRALGRALAALVADDGALEDYKRYTLGNRGGASADQSRFAWGTAEPKNVPWGTLGYAQLSMGRDRYAEYAAQRLARSAVERLLRGHYDKSDESPADLQIKKRLDNNRNGLDNQLHRIMPLPGQSEGWINQMFQGVVERWTQRMMGVVQDQIPNAQNKRGSEWVIDVTRALQISSSMVDNDQRQELYSGVAEWASAGILQEGLLGLLRSEIAKFGVPYGSALLLDIRHKIEDNLVAELRQLSDRRAPQAVVLDETQRAALESDRGRIDDSTKWTQEIVAKIAPQLRNRAMAMIAQHMASVLHDFVSNFITPLQRNIQMGHADLEDAMTKTSDSDLGVAQLKTNVPALWPDESQNTVPTRFSQAANEVFLTEVDSFVGQFITDITQSARTEEIHNFDYEQALNVSAQRVVSGNWESLSGSEAAPRDLIRLIEVWVARDLAYDPENSGEHRDPRPARFQFNISSAEVLERARQYIRRPGFSFQQFISSSLRDFVTAPGLSESERGARRQQVLSKFSEAMTYALPLAQINTQLVRAIYNDEVRYEFNFSQIPFGGDELGDSLKQAVRDYPNHRPADITKPLGSALVNQGEERHIDIFGSYPNYVPIVFDSLLPPIEKQWRQTAGTRSEFWNGRRARPLPAALPMTDTERLAMVKGWYIGRIIGRIYFPETLDTADTTPVQIHEEQSKQWVNFDTPLLTPVSRFRAGLDWLPSLLESVSLAWARSGEQPLFRSVQPYILLRQLWDDAPSPSLGGRTTRGRRLLHEWLYNGERMAGEVNQIAGTGVGATPAERLEITRAWLQRQHEIAQAYVPSAKLGEGRLFNTADRPFADITDRSVSAKVPVFADIAPDVTEATADIINILEACLQAGPPQAETGFVPTFDPRAAQSGAADLPGAGEF